MHLWISCTNNTVACVLNTHKCCELYPHIEWYELTEAVVNDFAWKLPVWIHDNICVCGKNNFKSKLNLWRKLQKKHSNPQSSQIRIYFHLISPAKLACGWTVDLKLIRVRVFGVCDNFICHEGDVALEKRGNERVVWSMGFLEFINRMSFFINVRKLSILWPAYTKSFRIKRQKKNRKLKTETVHQMYANFH